MIRKSNQIKEKGLVLRNILPLFGENYSKWAPNYKGSYIVNREFLAGALLLT